MYRYNRIFPCLLALLATACGTFDLHVEYSPTSVQTATAFSTQPSTLTPLPSLPDLTPTYTSPDSLIPTATLGVDSAQRIRFELGATSVMIGDTLPAAGVLDYVIAAGQGQILSAGVQTDLAPDAPVDVSVYSLPDGRLLGGQNKGWKGVLPATQDYLIRLWGAPQAVHFYLYIDIPAWISIPAEGGAATLTGTVGPQGAFITDQKLFTQPSASYLLIAGAGQKLVVTVTSPGTVVLLNIGREGDNQPIARDVTTGNHVELELPADDTYRIMPVNESGQTVSFTLEVTLSP